jgi:hypothetical protein
MVQWSTIETAATEPGTPDLHGCYLGNDAWIEAKLTSGFAVHVKPSQVVWHTLRHAAGGTSYFAVRRVKRFRYDELYIVRGSYAAKLKGVGLSGVPHVAMFPGGPARWSWDQILGLLFARA